MMTISNFTPLKSKTGISPLSNALSNIAESVNNSKRVSERFVFGSDPNSDVAKSLLDNIDQTLCRVERILLRMQMIAEAANSGNISVFRLKELEEEFERLKEELDALAESSGGFFDGTFGGVRGARGISAMGIISITSSGNISGNAQVNISGENGNRSMTVRINGEEITARITDNSRKASFRLRDGSGITVSFDNPRALVSGTSNRISFTRGESTPDLRNAMSADDRPKDMFIRPMPQSGNLDPVRIPPLRDISAFGLGLRDIRIGDSSSARRAIDRISAVSDKIARDRTLVRLTAIEVMGPEAIRMQQELTERAERLSIARQMLASRETSSPNREVLGRSILSNPTQSIFAATNFLSRNAAFRFFR